MTMLSDVISAAMSDLRRARLVSSASGNSVRVAGVTIDMPLEVTGVSAPRPPQAKLDGQLPAAAREATQRAVQDAGLSLPSAVLSALTEHVESGLRGDGLWAGEEPTADSVVRHAAAAPESPLASSPELAGALRKRLAALLGPARSATPGLRVKLHRSQDGKPPEAASARITISLSEDAES